MATPQDSARGKTGGFELTKQCDLCSSTKPTKYCPECEVQLCKTCIGTHGKLKATQEHPLLDINLLSTGSTYANSGNCESGLTKCTKHSNETLQFYCNNCGVFVCAICHLSHKKHSVQNVKDDLKLYQTICTDHIKKLLDNADDLKEYKGIIEGFFSSYDEALNLVHKWEKELQELIRECSRKLTEELTKTRNEWENNLKYESEELVNRMGDVEDKISQLYNARKVSDIDIFSHELAASQQLLEKLEYFQKHVLPTKLTVPKTSDILSQMSQLPTVKSGIKKLLSTGNSKTPQASAQHSSAKLRYSDIDFEEIFKNRQFCLDIPDPDSSRGYGICKSNFIDNEIILYGVARKDIRVLDIDTKRLKRLGCATQIWDMISMNSSQYIAMEKQKLHLLNSDFRVIHTCKSVKDVLCGLSFLSPLSFAILGYNHKNKEKVACISVYDIIQGKLVFKHETEVSVVEQMLFIGAQDSVNLFICGSRHLYKVNIKNSTYEHSDLVSYLLSPWCLTAVKDGVLIGDGGGKVHLLDNSFNHKLVLNLSRPAIRDLFISNEYLVVSTMENKLFTYKLRNIQAT